MAAIFCFRIHFVWCVILPTQGSDGIWEFITSQEAIDMVVESKNINEACERLVDEATRRWRQEEDVIDDITCIVIELNGYVPNEHT
jgi:serine/threonine protein phosphatase PrpC